jgi:hypothetical protein
LSDFRHSQEQIDFINNEGDLDEAYIPTLMVKFTLEQDEFDEEYIRFDTHWQCIIHPTYLQLSNNYGIYTAYNLQPGHNPKISLVVINQTTQKEIADHVIRPAIGISACSVKA